MPIPPRPGNEASSIRSAARATARLGSKSAVAPITPDVLALPEVAFFVARNPGYRQGDELAMIARVDARAVIGMAAKWVRKGLRRPSGRLSTPTPAPVGWRG